MTECTTSADIQRAIVLVRSRLTGDTDTYDAAAQDAANLDRVPQLVPALVELYALLVTKGVLEPRYVLDCLHNAESAMIADELEAGADE